MIAAAVHQLRALLRPPDRRSPQEVDEDVADELAFHIEALERESLADGASPDGARAEALRRFGNPERIRAACRRIDLEERIMLQRLNAVLTVLLLLAVVVLGLQVYRAQARSTALLERLERSMVAMAEVAQPKSVAREPQKPSLPQTPASQSPQSVLVLGMVTRPGEYELPLGAVLPPDIVRAADTNEQTSKGWVECVRLQSGGKVQILRWDWQSGEAFTSQNVPHRGWPVLGTEDVLLIRHLGAAKGERPPPLPADQALEATLQEFLQLPAPTLGPSARLSLQAALRELRSSPLAPPDELIDRALAKIAEAASSSAHADEPASP